MHLQPGLDRLDRGRSALSGVSELKVFRFLEASLPQPTKTGSQNLNDSSINLRISSLSTYTLNLSNLSHAF